MMHRLFLFLWLFSTALTSVSAAVPEPPREFRGTWVAAVHNLDWPSSPGLSASAQQAQLRSLLDTAASLNLNAVLLQVRPAGDALYASRLEPWSPYLTGKMGVSPGYDPLAFAVTEAHSRGLELHAWFNPFRAQATTKYGLSSGHAAAQHPEYVRKAGSQSWFDPGEPWVRDHAIAVMSDVARRYDVDGIHVDDYFYPYPPSGVVGLGQNPFNDEASYARYGRGAERSAWRRANIDSFVKSLYSSIKSTKPWVKVGISPFGIWRPNVPSGIEAKLDAFEYLAADSRTWFKQGWLDYFSPQLYWRIDPPAQSFSALHRWWSGQNGSGRHFWPGVAVDRISSSVDPGRPAQEIIRQIQIATTREGKGGAIHWSAKSLKQNRGGIADLLKTGLYRTKALVPASPWLGSSRPSAPQVSRQGQLISWSGKTQSTRWWCLQAKVNGQWLFVSLFPAQTTSATWPKGAEAVAIRGVSFSGVAGDATTL